MKARSTYILPLALLCALLVVVQTAGYPGRILLQNTCPAGCSKTKCVEDKTTGKFKCNKCVNNLVVTDGKCACRAGRYVTNGDADKEPDVSNNKPVCALCSKGSWCPGTLITAAASAQKLECKDIGGADSQPGLTTTINAAKSKWACVEKAGYGYSVVDGEPSATACNGDTYNSGFSKRQCQTCPTGFAIDDANKLTSPLLAKHDNVTDCMVPPGFFQRGPSEVAACPQGEYRDDYNRASRCLACPVGVTTVKGKVNTHAEFCNTLKPGFFAYAGVSAVTVKTAAETGHGHFISQDAKLCPQGHWCPGGKPTAVYNNSASETDLVTIFKCIKAVYGAASGTPAGPLWTKARGARSKDECLLPPGYGLVGDRAIKCSSGFYREGWAQPSDPLAACQPCADEGNEFTTSSATESLRVFPNLDDATEEADLVIGSSAACEMKPGYGMYRTALGIRVQACDSNSYGSPNVTYGRTVNPCRSCPTNMITPSGGIASADASIKNDDSTGYTSPLACVTLPGWGWDGRVSSQCPVGSYNGGGNQNECDECPYGYTTADSATLQVSIDSCELAPGYQVNTDNTPFTVEECPLGTYIEVMHNTSVPCTSCGGNRWTYDTGSDKADNCEACKPGYGKAIDVGLAADCTDCSLLAGYGPVSRDNTACLLCPTQSTGFTFIYDDNTEQFIAAPVIRPAQTSSTGCLSSFAQIESGLWFLEGADQPNDALNIEACAASCGDDCLFLTFDYAGPACVLKVVQEGTEELLAFKAVPAGDIMGVQSSGVQAQAVASGLYVQWEVDTTFADSIGTTGDPVAQGTKGACMAVCDMDGLCAGVRMTGTGATQAAAASATISTCRFVYGEVDAGALASGNNLSKRSLTHVVVSRLT